LQPENLKAPIEISVFEFHHFEDTAEVIHPEGPGHQLLALMYSLGVEKGDAQSLQHLAA